MNTVTVRAPGKLLLSGEYAVLRGAPALCAAVDRFACVELRPSSGAWSVHAAQIGVHGAPVDPTSPAPEQGAVRLAHLVIAAAVQQVPGMSPREVHIDTSDLYTAKGAKLGLGSSAAVASALWGALRYGASQLELPEPAELLKQVRSLHTRFQGGSGSGVDVAASTMGGVVRYSLDSAGASQTAHFSMPAGVTILPFYTGSSASTPGMVARVLAVIDAAPDVQPMWNRLAELAATVCESTTADAFLAAVDAYGATLQELGVRCDTPIFTKAHSELKQVVESHGGVYKPSGAGGGDVGVAFFAEGSALDIVIADAEAIGCEAVPSNIARCGVEVRI